MQKWSCLVTLLEMYLPLFSDQIDGCDCKQKGRKYQPHNHSTKVAIKAVKHQSLESQTTQTKFYCLKWIIKPNQQQNNTS